MIGLGVQSMLDLYGCDVRSIDDVRGVERKLNEAARRCGATIVASCFHQFNPHGVSGVVVIAESHLAIHTWPEHGYAAIDLFTCGDLLAPEVCFDYLREAFRSTRHSVRTVSRGEAVTLEQRLAGV
jgi:S-adenosylmethionine decarboxylase